MQKKSQKIATRADIAAMVVAFCLVLVLYILFSRFLTVSSALFGGLLAILLYFSLLFVWALWRLRHGSIDDGEAFDSIFDSEFGDVIADMHHPVLLTDEAGHSVFCNSEFLSLCGRETLIAGTPLDHLCTVTVEDGVTYADFDMRRCELYRAEMSAGTQVYTLLNFYEKTDEIELARRCREERTVVAYAIIDNIEEILQFVQDNYAETSTRVEEELRRWMAEINGVLRAYDRNKYMLIFDNVHLERCLEDRFAILDRIRSVRVGDGMPITISLGVSHLADAGLAEREQAAQYALDLALQRGGDQVVVRDEVGVSFYGGRTKAGYKRVNIKARVIAAKLLSLVGRAGNVIIMGHNYGDYDSFAASIGLARLVINQGIRVNVAVTRDQPNLRECFERLSGLSEYNGLFVDEAEALDLLGADTLVIVVDVNNFSYAECPDVLAKATSVAVIDHHIKAADLNSAVKLEYVDPTASSASELVSEIIEYSVGARVLRPEEAELLLSGVLLDTKRFTRNTGTRTFAVAQFLRGAGANPGETFEFFKTTPDELAKESRFNSHVQMYRNRIAIAACEEGEFVDQSYRTVAARVADSLLGVKGVNVSFAIVRIEDTVYISARSDGTVNVQVILEKLKGGGHFDVAGAQISKVSLESAMELLRKSIDDYLDNKQKGEVL